MKKIKLACVIDDDSVYTYTVRQMMLRSGIAEDIIFFNDGQSALDYLLNAIESEQLLPDVILLDLNMPIVDGWQFLEEFEKHEGLTSKNIPLYIVSSSIDDDDLKKAQEIEAVTSFISKPPTQQDLLEILNHVNTHNQAIN